MVDDRMIKRINELAHKMKNEGLSDEEKEEQATLRKRYVEAFRSSLKAQLEMIKVEE